MHDKLRKALVIYGFFKMNRPTKSIELTVLSVVGTYSSLAVSPLKCYITFKECRNDLETHNGSYI